MMYALNRELEYYDMPQVRKIVRDAAASNYTFAASITGIVNSDDFRRQGPDATTEGRRPGQGGLRRQRRRATRRSSDRRNRRWPCF